MGSSGKGGVVSFTAGFKEGPEKWQKTSDWHICLSMLRDNFKISDAMGYNKAKEVICES